MPSVLEQLEHFSLHDYFSVVGRLLKVTLPAVLRNTQTAFMFLCAMGHLGCFPGPASAPGQNWGRGHFPLKIPVAKLLRQTPEKERDKQNPSTGSLSGGKETYSLQDA